MSELTFEDYLRNLRDHPDEGVRANAAWRLGRTRDHRCLAALVAAASDPSPAVRARVMEALGSRREPEVTPAIAQGLHDADPDVRAMAARAAALMAATELTPHLFDLLADPSERVVEEAIQALAYSDHPEVGPRLIALLRAQADNDTLCYFLRQALKHRGGAATLEVVLVTLSDAATPPAVCCDLLEVLAHMRPSDAAAHAAVDALTAHPDEAVRQMAEWARTQL
ncbi:HEAT repeat domain-containing protein [Aggregatilineales bacterium SYSU G02658]